MQSGYSLDTVVLLRYASLRLARLPDEEKILKGFNILLG